MQHADNSTIQPNPTNMPKAKISAAPSSQLPGIDKLIIVSLSIFFVIALFVDYINALAPIGGVSIESSKLWKWPPQFVWDLYFFWVQIDPLLHAQPAWCQFVSWLSPFIYAPFYLWAIYCIYNRKEAIRIPMIIYASLLFETLAIYYYEAIWGAWPSPNLWLYTTGYGYYFIFPLIVIYRFWHDHPFTPKEKSA
jgi:hypothetical protein